LVQRHFLNGAAAVHAITPEESTDIQAVARPRRLITIPNGIDLDEFPISRSFKRPSSDSVVLGYLGRISPEKNLLRLAESLSLCNREGRRVCLKLAGPASPHLDRIIQQHGHCGVEWVGPKYGHEKTQYLNSIDLMVVPSLAEVISISAIEALAMGVPLLITRTSKISYLYDSRSFFMCEPTVLGISQGIESAIGRLDQWIERIERGRKLVEERLNWAVIVPQFIEEYRKIIIDASGPRP
jgi:glycosyltransferase involved in cell wall biosynthesis